MSENLRENYSLMFTAYPDIVDITQMRKMLGGIGVTLAYKLLKQRKIKSLKIGREYKIPKSCIIEYLIENKENETKYAYKLWQTLTNIKDKSPNKYQTFLNMYTPYFSNLEINELFNQIIFATEQDYQYIAKYTLQKRRWRIENNKFL